MKKIILHIIIIISLVFIVYFSYKIINYVKEEKIQKNLNENIIDTAVKIEENKKAIDNNDNDNNKKNDLPIEVDFKTLKNINKDIVAWIYSENTPINYPIAQAKDNDYYLKRLIDGTYNQSGTIFLDYKNNRNFEDYNSIIYGHNMKNKSMFGTLYNYKEQEYYNEHKEMYLITENKSYKIELFAGYITSSESDIYFFPKTSNTNKKMIETAFKNSTFKSEINVSSEDKIITLSTCSYNYENARYVLLGVLKEVEY